MREAVCGTRIVSHSSSCSEYAHKESFACPQKFARPIQSAYLWTRRQHDNLAEYVQKLDVRLILHCLSLGAGRPRERRRPLEETESRKSAIRAVQSRRSGSDSAVIGVATLQTPSLSALATLLVTSTMRLRSRPQSVAIRMA